MEGFSVSSEAVPRRIFWVKFFHGLPHRNLTLSPIDRSFDPFSTVYQESLGIIGSVPAAILILTLLVLLVYLLTRCCDHKPRKADSISCLKATCVFTSLLTLGALGVSIWGNEHVHDGVRKAVYALDFIDVRIKSLTNMTKFFHETIDRNLEPDLNLFRETVEKKKIDNTTSRLFLLENLQYIKRNISEVLLINVEDIRTKLNRANFTSVVSTLGIAELGRWLSRITLTGILMLVVIIVPMGVACHSRCTLITFSVLGLISLIICWSSTSGYLVLNVAISDCCMDPNPFLEERLSHVVSRPVAVYYMKCDPTVPSPFTRYLTHSQQAADVIESTLRKVIHVADDNYVPNDIHPRLDRLDAYVKQSQRTLGDIGGLLECQDIHQHYLTMLNAICYRTITGFVYLFLSAAGSGLLFTFLVLFTSHTWIYLNNKIEHPTTTTTTNYGDRERFIPDRIMRTPNMNPVGSSGPRPRHSHTPPQTPPFPGTLTKNGHIFHSEGMGLGGGQHINGPGVPLGSNGAPPTSNTMPRNSHHGHHHNHGHHHHGHGHGHGHGQAGPNQGQYATLSKQCKTLESSDFY